MAQHHHSDYNHWPQPINLQSPRVVDSRIPPLCPIFNHHSPANHNHCSTFNLFYLCVRPIHSLHHQLALHALGEGMSSFLSISLFWWPRPVHLAEIDDTENRRAPNANHGGLVLGMWREDKGREHGHDADASRCRCTRNDAVDQHMMALLNVCMGTTWEWTTRNGTRRRVLCVIWDNAHHRGQWRSWEMTLSVDTEIIITTMISNVLRLEGGDIGNIMQWMSPRNVHWDSSNIASANYFYLRTLFMNYCVIQHVKLPSWPMKKLGIERWPGFTSPAFMAAFVHRFCHHAQTADSIYKSTNVSFLINERLHKCRRREARSPFDAELLHRPQRAILSVE